MDYEGLIGETVRIKGHNGDLVDAYMARPLGPGPYPAILINHYMPLLDETTKEIARRFAVHNYIAIAPHLHHRIGPGTPDEIFAKVRADGGMDDTQVLGDMRGAIDYLRALPYSDGKVAAIGFCSGGRQVYLAAGKGLPIDAGINCWGGRVVMKPEDIGPKMPEEPLSLTKNIKIPILSLSGNDDTAPSPAEIDKMEEELKKHKVEHEVYRYDGAAHSFFAPDRPGYRREQALDGWQKVFAFLEKHIGGGKQVW